MRALRNLWSGAVIALLVPIAAFRVTGFVLGLMWKGWRTRAVFRRALLRAGLTVEEADALTSRYHEPIPFREWLRLRHRFGN